MAIDRADWHWESAENEFRETHGITSELTQEQISALIESVVQAMNSITIEVTDFKDTQAIGFEVEDKADDQGD